MTLAGGEMTIFGLFERSTFSSETIPLLMGSGANWSWLSFASRVLARNVNYMNYYLEYNFWQSSMYKDSHHNTSTPGVDECWMAGRANCCGKHLASEADLKIRMSLATSWAVRKEQAKQVWKVLSFIINCKDILLYSLVKNNNQITTILWERSRIVNLLQEKRSRGSNVEIWLCDSLRESRVELSCRS